MQKYTGYLAFNGRGVLGADFMKSARFHEIHWIFSI